MGQQSKWDYFKAIYRRYRHAAKDVKEQILDEFCRVCRYNRKYAIRKLNGPPPERRPRRGPRKRAARYGSETIAILHAVWEAAGFPWSERLKAVIADWMPWIRHRFHPSAEVERQLLSISARQIDRRLKSKKAHVKKRIYGRTKPGSLLKHHIPIRTDNWDVKTPGFAETDTVSHSGNSGEGTFAYTVNLTDILTGWVESRAVLGKGETGVVSALDDIRASLPFPLRGLDSDNGSEFINWHLVRYCRDKKIQPFRSRPYKKDDNAHIEQKNWTHVRRLVGWERYDTDAAVRALNDLYARELRLFMNLFVPSVKLLRKKRVGSKLQRIYDKPQTPFQRLRAARAGDPLKLSGLQAFRDTLNPFDLAETIDKKLKKIWALANRRQSPRASKN